MTLFVGYLLSLSNTAFDLLTVSPGKLMPPNFWIWTIFTHSLVEVCHFCSLSPMGCCEKGAGVKSLYYCVTYYSCNSEGISVDFK